MVTLADRKRHNERIRESVHSIILASVSPMSTPQLREAHASADYQRVYIALQGLHRRRWIVRLGTHVLSAATWWASPGFVRASTCRTCREHIMVEERHDSYHDADPLFSVGTYFPSEVPWPQLRNTWDCGRHDVRAR